ncbi:MAG: alanine--glyoxylate aminotransferase family protein [Acidobacteriota bacterium]|nr:MAG: alanine--glyoxylate aminotransferase family protein [Acidobacteriota bacterium]
MSHVRVFCPGPIEVDAEILGVMSAPQRIHYGRPFAELYERVVHALRPIFGTEGYVAVLPGCGTLANEMAIRALLDEGETALIVDSGFYADRIEQAIFGCGGKAERLRLSEGSPADPADLERALEAHKVDLICIVHVETSTGLVNPLRELADVARRHEIPVLVDAVASLGATRCEMDAWGIAIMTSASQKALEAPPGLGLIAVSDASWSLIESKASPKGLFTDLRYWKKSYDAERYVLPAPVTMPVAVVDALEAALAKIHTEGLTERYLRHERAGSFFRDAITELGLEIVAEPKARATNVTAVHTSGRFRPDELVEFLEKRHRLRIATGVGDLQHSVFRVGHMGDNAREEALSPVIAGIVDFLARDSL